MVSPKQSASQLAYTHQRMNMKRLPSRLPGGVRSSPTSQLGSRPSQQKLHTTRRTPVSSRDQVAAAYASVYLPSPASKQNDVFKRLSTTSSGLQLNSHVINMTANHIQAHWEGVQSSLQSVRTVQLSTYISTILTRTSLAPVTNSALTAAFPSFSCIALVLALIYVDRLKKMHPAAKGEAGCGLRLFLVSYMVATKYIQAHFNSWAKCSPSLATTSPVKDTTESQTSQPIQTVPLSSLLSPNEHWARLSSIFSTPELTRMELELLSFLQFDLFVSYEDFKYYWTMYMEINQAVPAENPSPVFEPSYGDDEYAAEDGCVPDL
ncbi:hypothetical protein K7432_002302 [Basidiobolus ranarum]|uniref:RGS domain-containing protein n=1 Tax=Basidiobolus ranarum TaxID=34480 RepID=A0ABR2X1Q6_9FUNG